MRNLIIFAFVIAVLGCREDKNCKNAICTAMFASITVQLKDTTNLNLSGVTTQTLLVSSGQAIHNQTEPDSFPEGSFTVVDDSDLKELGFNANQKVELKISKDGNLIKTVPYTITTDCCHVNKTDGPLEVSLN